MDRLLTILVSLGAAWLLFSCAERREYREMLARAEAVMSDRPDSALMILDSLGLHEKEFDRHFRMQYLLHHADAHNKTDSAFTADSLCKELADHFDSHGTANERMLAHYLLGRAHTDKGEAPRAVSSYQDAIDAADTMETDCDFNTLLYVYSQMADVFYHQLLLTNEIEARKKASHYAFRANKPLWGIYNIEMIAGTYILLNKKDSAEIIIKSVIAQYRKYGYIQRALRASKVLMHIYTDDTFRLTEAKALMDQFESESELFDEHHELPPSQRHYYNYKGKYYEGIHRLDSAEYYYRKIYRPGMSYVSQDPMYRGLLSVFSKRHQADSIAKYARLYCMANDSSIALKDRDIVAQMAASYNYNRLQKEAHGNEMKAYRAFFGLMVALVIIGLLLIAAFLTWRYYRKKYQQKIAQLKTELAETTEEYEENLRQLQQLEATHKTVIATIQQELTDAQGESSEFREKYAKSQQTVSQLNQDYDVEKSRLLAENEALQKRIGELQKIPPISKHLAVSESFAKENIVRRIWEIAQKPLMPVAEEEWDELTKAFGNSYPALLQDLCRQCNTPLNIRVCFLTAMNIGSGEQANMLGKTKQRISNSKSDVNKILFNDASSRTLYRNLVTRYNIYCFTGIYHEKEVK